MVCFIPCENDLQRLSQITSYCAQTQETKEISNKTKEISKKYYSRAYQNERTIEERFEYCFN